MKIQNKSDFVSFFSMIPPSSIFQFIVRNGCRRSSDGLGRRKARVQLHVDDGEHRADDAERHEVKGRERCDDKAEIEKRAEVLSAHHVDDHRITDGDDEPLAT